MTNFKDAFLRGITSSDDADRLRSEALAVFKDFIEQIVEASDGKLTLYLREPFLQSAGKSMAAMAAALTGEAAMGTGAGTQAIYVEVRVGNVSGGADSIGRVTFAPSTYPIELDWERDVRMCHDRDELARGLQQLAEDPRTGKKFRVKLDSYASVASLAAKAARPALDVPSSESGGSEE